MMKKLTMLLLAAMLALCGAAMGEDTADLPAYEPLPLGGPAPYAAVPGALSEDGLHYDDGSLKVDIETAVVDEVTVYYVYVTAQDRTQLRTATAGNPRSKTTLPVYAMAEQNNAVLAFNGDFYNYRDVGVVYRSGERIRYNIRQGMDMLIVDENGDLVIIESPTKTKVENYLREHQIVEAFSFGPALIRNGERLQFKYAEKNSCGYPTPDERLIICQMASEGTEKNFLFIACDDPGLSVRRMTDLAQEKGVVTAYNLDGGHSTSVYLCGARINKIPKDRAVGDIIYFATLAAPAGEQK
ncbi:MAG: phosphodiester glycosidase family protein [Clostridia bacterium]|nr:phosphodiester glycosidase family protein [Clostridia bacterium]